ncbi:MAG: hypothetical protein WDA20_00330 [Desulfuromonadales bacterium]
MTGKSINPGKKSAGKKKSGYMCEVCRCRITKEEAAKTDYLHCGRKMTPLEVAYMSDPSPTGA